MNEYYRIWVAIILLEIWQIQNTLENKHKYRNIREVMWNIIPVIPVLLSIAKLLVLMLEIAAQLLVNAVEAYKNED